MSSLAVREATQVTTFLIAMVVVAVFGGLIVRSIARMDFEEELRKGGRR